MNSKGESQLFYLNKVLVQYLVGYSADIELVYTFKNSLANSQQFAKYMIGRQGGFECGHYILTRMKTTSVLLQLLSKFIQSKKEENRYVALIAEMVLGQLGEECFFVKAVVQTLFAETEAIIERKEDERFIVSFLMFYERFIWNNKKVKEIFEVYQEFIKRNGIALPAPLICFDEQTKPFNQLINDYSEKLSAYKLQIDKIKLLTRSAQTIAALSEISDLKTQLSENVSLCVNKTALKSMEIQIFQVKYQ